MSDFVYVVFLFRLNWLQINFVEINRILAKLIRGLEVKVNVPPIFAGGAGIVVGAADLKIRSSSEKFSSI